MDEHIQRQLHASWMIKSTHKDSKEEMIAGGLCIDPRGILVTPTHTVTLNSRNYNAPEVPQSPHYATVVCRKFSQSRFRQCTLIQSVPHLGLSFFRVVPNGNDDHHYHVVPSDEGLSLHRGDTVFTYVHADSMPFSLVTITIGQQYEGLAVPVVPAPDDNRTIIQATNPVSWHHIDRAWKMLGTIIKRSDMEVNPNSPSQIITHSNLFFVHRELPLIEASWYYEDATSPGLYGSPVFRGRDGELVGLNFWSQFASLFIVPSNVIREAFQLLPPVTFQRHRRNDPDASSPSSRARRQRRGRRE